MENHNDNIKSHSIVPSTSNAFYNAKRIRRRKYDPLIIKRKIGLVLGPSTALYKSFLSKIEKVPRGIRGEKSSKDMASSRNLVSTIGAQASPTMGDGTKCPEGKAAFPAGMPHPLQSIALWKMTNKAVGTI